MDGRMDGRMDGWKMDRRTKTIVNVMEGRTDRRRDGRTDGQKAYQAQARSCNIAKMEITDSLSVG